MRDKQDINHFEKLFLEHISCIMENSFHNTLHVRGRHYMLSRKFILEISFQKTYSRINFMSFENFVSKIIFQKFYFENFVVNILFLKV